MRAMITFCAFDKQPLMTPDDHFPVHFNLNELVYPENICAFNFNRFTCLNPLGRHLDKVLVNSTGVTPVASKNLKLEFIMLCKSSTCIYTAQFLDNLHSECGLDSQLEAIPTL